VEESGVKSDKKQRRGVHEKRVKSEGIIEIC
jgi:hypothetical protein